MTLLAPGALWFSSIGAAVIALYILKIKRRRQAVPSLEFWRDLAGTTQVRSLFQRLKRWRAEQAREATRIKRPDLMEEGGS